MTEPAVGNQGYVEEDDCDGAAGYEEGFEILGADVGDVAVVNGELCQKGFKKCWPYRGTLSIRADETDQLPHTDDTGDVRYCLSWLLRLVYPIIV